MAKKAESDDESPARTNARQEIARRNLENWIVQSGYSVTEVADMAGIPQANLARYVNGKSAIRVDVLQPLADVLGRASTHEFQMTDPPKQRHRDELEIAQPMFAKSRPGFEPTEQDLKDFQDYLAKVQSRRAKKPKR